MTASLHRFFASMDIKAGLKFLEGPRRFLDSSAGGVEGGGEGGSLRPQR